MTSPWSSPRSKYIKYVRLDTVGRPARKEAGRPFLYCIGGKPPSYTVGTYQPVMWFSVHTPGGTHRSRPTNHMGSPLVSVGRHLRVPPCGIWAGPPPHRDEPIPPHAPPPTGAEGPKALSPQQCEAWIENPTAPIQSHRTGMSPYRPMHHPPAGLRGLWPSHRNNAKHGLRTLPHPFRATAPNH